MQAHPEVGLIAEPTLGGQRARPRQFLRAVASPFFSTRGQPPLLHHLLHGFRLAFAKIRVTGVHHSNRRCADPEFRGHKDG